MPAVGVTCPPLAVQKRGTGRLAYAGLVVFVLVVYSNPGNFFDGLADVGFAKIAAAAALAALFGAWLLADRKLHLGGAVGALVLGLFAWVGASAAWSLWPQMTRDTFLDGLKFFAIFLLAANVVDDRRRATGFVHLIAFASVIPALGAITSWARGEHLVDGDRAAWIGIFANPNDLAHYLVVGLALALTGREVTRARLLKILYLPAMATLGVALLLTQSRGGMIAACVVIGLYALRSVARGRVAVGVLVAAIAVFELVPNEEWRGRAETTLDYKEDASAQGRIDAWRTGWNIVKDRPLTGVGAGAFTLAWPSYAPGDAGPARTAHNTFIQLLGETGVPSLFLFGLAIFLGYRAAGRALGNPELAPIARGARLGIIAFLVCSLTNGLAWSWPLYLLLGLAVALPRAADAAKTSPLRPASAVGA